MLAERGRPIARRKPPGHSNFSDRFTARSPSCASYSRVLVARDRMELAQTTAANHCLSGRKHPFYILRLLATECAHEWNPIRGRWYHLEIDPTKRRWCRVVRLDEPYLHDVTHRSGAGQPMRIRVRLAVRRNFTIHLNPGLIESGMNGDGRVQCLRHSHASQHTSLAINRHF